MQCRRFNTWEVKINYYATCHTASVISYRTFGQLLLHHKHFSMHSLAVVVCPIILEINSPSLAMTSCTSAKPFYLRTYVHPFDVESRCADLINQLNHLPESDFTQTDQWFTNTYGWDWNDGKSADSNGVKKVWLTKNSRKIDMMRHQIKEWKESKRINKQEEDVLLLSLILGINKISNVVGHQNGYLKEWCAGAQRDLLLTVPNIAPNPTTNHQQYVGDIFTTMKQVTADIAYFDPPYGTNNKNLSVATRYSSFYHLWNTLVTNERPVVFGKASKPISTKGYTEPLERNKRTVVIPKFVRLIEEVRSPIVCFFLFQ